MKKVYFALALLILVLQVRLLSSNGGLSELFALQTQLAELKQDLTAQKEINAKLLAEVKLLQKHPESIETIARQTLGMVKKDEVFIKVIQLPPKPKNKDSAVTNSTDD